MPIGATIRILRKEKKVTQEALAEYLHISSQAVSKWETGASAPDIALLPKLAIFFDTSLDRLLDFDQRQVDASIDALIRDCEKQSRGNAAKAERLLRKALERYPNNDLLLTRLLDTLQEQNADKSRSAEIIEIGERVLTWTKDDEVRIDVLRILAETCRSTGEQAMAEYYLAKIPALNFFYYEIAAAVKRGKARLEQISLAEGLCIDKLACMLAMRKQEEIDPAKRIAIDRQAHELFAFLKNYPTYREAARIMEWHWDNGNIMQIYQ